MYTLSDKCLQMCEAIKSQTARLRAKSGISPTDIVNALHCSNTNTKNSALEKLTNDFQVALDAYLNQLRRLIKVSEFIMPACFLTYRPESLKELFSGCCDPETTLLVLRETNNNFVEREIPDIQIEIANVFFPSYAKTKAKNGDPKLSSRSLLQHKRRAVENLIQSISPNLVEDARASLANKILNELCPSRWVQLCKAALSVAFGNLGLVSFAKMEDCRGKATITKQQHFERSDGKTVLVSVPSRWQIKEDPQRVSHLQRELNPESAIAVVKATYEVVFSASKNMDEHAHEFCGKFKFSISSSDFKQRHPSLSRRQGSRLGNDVSTVASLLSGDFSSSLSKTGSISRSKSSLISMDSKGPSRQTSDISIRSENSQSHCSTSTHRPVIKQPLHPQRQQQARYEHASSSEHLAQGRRHWPKPIRPMQFRSDSFQSHLNESSRLGDTHKTQLSPIGDCYRDNELGGEFGSVSSNYSKPNSWPRLPHGQAPHLPPTGDPEVDRYARRLHINKQPVKPPPPPGMEGSESYYDSSNNLEWSTPTTSSGWNDSTKIETWNPQAHENTMLESPSSNDLSSVGGLRMPDHGSTGHLSSNSFHRRTSSWNEHWN